MARCMDELSGWIEARVSAARTRSPRWLKSCLAPGLTVVALLVAGYFLSHHYGVSWDEPDTGAFAREALQAYLDRRPRAEWYVSLEPYGPFFVATAEMATRLLVRLRPSWSDVEARHFAYFLSFPLAAAALYGLARRLVSQPAALASVLLFAAQPLLFGHAFINPKDTPFMAFFAASVWSGLWMVDAFARSSGDGPHPTAKLTIFRLALAGVILGLSTSIRLFGPFAGVLVTVLAMVRMGRKSLGPLALYWATATVVCYLTWPYLWGDPIRRLAWSVRFMLDFPWDNPVLYRGLAYPAPDLPWHYLPFVTLAQLTEPLVLLALLGSLFGIARLVEDRTRMALYIVVGLWIAVPYAAAVLGDITVYDNSRQFLFAFPPLFLSAALGFEAIFRRARSALIRIGITVAAVAPGLTAMTQLHPYEYIYYNALVGGVPGAYREYELDYWGTSYRAAMEFVNSVAPFGATVVASGPWMSAALFAREDLVVRKTGEPLPPEAEPPSYFLTLARSNFDLAFMPGEPLLAEVTVEGATLAVVKMHWRAGPLAP